MGGTRGCAVHPDGHLERGRPGRRGDGGRGREAEVEEVQALRRERCPGSRGAVSRRGPGAGDESDMPDSSGGGENGASENPSVLHTLFAVSSSVGLLSIAAPRPRGRRHWMSPGFRDGCEDLGSPTSRWRREGARRSTCWVGARPGGGCWVLARYSLLLFVARPLLGMAVSSSAKAPHLR